MINLCAMFNMVKANRWHFASSVTWIVESTLTPYCDGDINPQNFVITLFIEDDEVDLEWQFLK